MTLVADAATKQSRSLIVTSALDAATDRVLSYEDRLAAAATTVLRKAGRIAARAFGERARASLVAAADWQPPHQDELIDVDAIVSALRTKSDPIRRSAIAHYGGALAYLHPDANWDVTNPLVGGVLAGAAQHVTDIADTTRINLMRIINASYDQGLSIEDTMKAIREGMDAASVVRGRLIARTELAAVTNGGSLAATKILSDASGDTYYKRWMTAPGAKYPRHEDYEGLDGQTVGLDEAFDVGGISLKFPGDPDGPPEEICNCRCSLAYVTTPAEEIGAAPEAEPPPELAEALAGVTGLPIPEAAGSSIREITTNMGAHELDVSPEFRPDLFKEPIKLKGGGFATPRNDLPAPRVKTRADKSTYGLPPRIEDTVQKHGFDEVVPGSERPPKYLFRAISEEDYQQSLQRGYIKSDERMNLAAEGTVADFNDPSFYLPGKLASDPDGVYPGRIVRIRYRDEDGWKLDHDGYAKTQDKIPMSQVDLVSPKIETVRTTADNGGPRFDTRIVPTQPGEAAVAWAAERGLNFSEPYAAGAGKMQISLRDPTKVDPGEEARLTKAGYVYEPERAGEVASVEFRPPSTVEPNVHIELVLTSKAERGKGYASAVIRRLTEIYPTDRYGFNADLTTKGGEAVIRGAIRDGVLPPGTIEPAVPKQVYRGFEVKRYEAEPSTVPPPPPGVSADIGITPFREGVDDPIGFYDSEKFSRFEQDARDLAVRFNVSLDAQERATGVWEGAEEPSVHFTVHDGETGVRGFSAALGRAYRQDGVAIFEPGLGEDVIATFRGGREIGPAERLADVVAAHPNVEIDASEHDGGVRISLLRVPVELRGKGEASAALDSILRYADMRGLPTVLTPETVGEGGLSKTALTKWYRKNGFVSNTGRNKDFRFRETLIRPPLARLANQSFTIGTPLDPAEVYAGMKKADLPAGRFLPNGDFQVFGSGPEFVGALDRLSGGLGVKYDYATGKFSLLEGAKGDYEQAIGNAQGVAEKQAGEARAAAPGLPGQPPLGEGAGGAEAGARPLEPDYRVPHQAPGPDSGAPMNDLANSAAGIYPADVYDTAQQAQLYGTGDGQYDRESFAAVNRARGNPDAEVTIYRGVPLGVSEINPGDWVTPSRGYARLNAAQERGIVISKTVRAGDLYTNGDSINEWGWHPQTPETPPQLAGLSAPPNISPPPLPPALAPWSASQIRVASADRLWGAHAAVGKAENAARAELDALGDDKLVAALWDRGLGQLPKGTLRFDDLTGDQQAHTVYSDGHASIFDMAEEALKRGEQQIVISDHAHAMTTAEIEAQHKAIDILNAHYGSRFKILKGIEANILADGTLDVAPEVLAKFDFVNAAIHAPIEGPAGQLALFEEANTTRLVRAMDNPELNVLVHPASVAADWDAVAAKAAEKNIALEINGRDMLRNDRQEATADLIAAAKRHGAKLVLGSDAHTTGDLVDLLYAVRFAAQHGVTADDLAPLARRASLADPSSSIPESFDASTSGGFRLGGGMNEVWKVEGADGREFIVKPEVDLEAFEEKYGIPEARLRENVEPGKDLERERAAYVVSRYFNEAGGDEFHVDTPAFRMGEFKRKLAEPIGGEGPFARDLVAGAEKTSKAGISEFVPGEEARSLGYWQDYATDEQVRSAALYDAIIGNTDRHAGNFLIDENEGELWLIDHGLAFPVGEAGSFQNTKIVDEAMSRGPEFLTDKEVAFLRRLRDNLTPLERELRGLLNPDEIKEMAERIDRMLDTRDFNEATQNRSQGDIEILSAENPGGYPAG